MGKFPFYKQHDLKDCGPTCLRMIAKFYGKTYSLQNIRDKSVLTREGVSMLGISRAAEQLGFRTMGARLTFDQLNKVPLPCIAHWRTDHFVVVYKIQNKKIHVADPNFNLVTYDMPHFVEGWAQNKSETPKGGVLLLQPTPTFYDLEEDKKSFGLGFFLRYFTPYKRYYGQLILGLFAGLVFSLIFPFLTQAIVDVGINNQNIGFVNLILIAQATLALSSTVLGFVRSWIFLHMSTRINVAIVSDYLAKLMRLPLSFFENKMIGDILQRINDNARIYAFFSNKTLDTLFSLFNLVIFAAIMAYYSLKILAVFVFFSILYAVWVVLFMKKRREFDFKLFERSTERQTSTIQMINGIRDIKLFNFEMQKLWEWERIQAQSFKINIQQMKLEQYQEAGAFFIDQCKNIFISYLAAKAVISGDISLGMMLAMQYILGQLNAPISQFIGFINSFQDARISLDRLREVHVTEAEDTPNEYGKATFYPKNGQIQLENLSFGYDGALSQYVLHNLNLSIPEGKVTAIVGNSGSGKTTLMKLLLNFYKPNEGRIRVGGIDLKNFDSHTWRDKCGVVLQDGYLFPSSIGSNIAMSDADVTYEKLEYAATMASINDHIADLPLGYNTKIGADGMGLSQGQKQRILIARAIYKNPEYLFFDEATNSLDSNNEKAIVENLNQFFQGRTVVVIAHRLSTVKNADQIIVLDKGKVLESGTHAELVERKTAYYQLVKNQLELDG
jgi:ATP-binding cassette, subfamily B, bacterial